MNENRSKGGKRRSGILWRMTVIVAALFVVSSIVSLVFYIRSTNKMVESSKEKLVKTQAQDMASTFRFVTDEISNSMIEKYEKDDIKPSDLAGSILSKKPLQFMVEAGDMLKEFEKNNMLDTDVFVAAIEPIPPYLDESLILISNRDDLTFTEPPESVQEILGNTSHYGIIEDGVPEWGLEGTQLAVYQAVDKDVTEGVQIYAMGVRSIDDDLAEIDSYYEDEMWKVDIAMIIVLVISLIAVLLVTFFVFRYLITSRITAPIEELSSIAESVMEGDLDVEVPIRKGEEFESLKKAFNEMLRSIRDVINRSSEE